MAALRRRRRSLARWASRRPIALVARVVDACLRWVWRSSRVVVQRPENDLDAQGERCVVLTLHQGLLLLMQHFRGRGAVVMASRSRDGDFVSAVLARLGFEVARGSDRRGGLHALDRMIDFVRSGRGSAGLTCDGPRGPYGAVKLGALKLARDSGRKIVPCAVWTSRKRLLANWDRTLVPLPFGRIAVCFGRPRPVPAEADWRRLRAIRDELEREIAELVDEARRVAESRELSRPAASPERATSPARVVAHAGAKRPEPG